MKIETLSIVYSPPKVLLGLKKVRFGKGKYNGFGGGLEDGETLEKCAVRETLEESGVEILNPQRIGMILFNFESDEPDHEVHFFRAIDFLGVPRESDEMKPEWFDENQIPYNKMWDDDKYWLPLLLRGQRFKGRFNFNLDSKIKSYKLKEVTCL